MAAAFAKITITIIILQCIYIYTHIHTIIRCRHIAEVAVSLNGQISRTFRSLPFTALHCQAQAAGEDLPRFGGPELLHHRGASEDLREDLEGAG